MRGSNRDIRGKEIMVEYEDWGGRGFNMETEDCGPLRGPLSPEGAVGRSEWSSHRWVAPRRRGDALVFSRRSSSTEDSVVVTTLYSLILTLRTRPPRQGYATVTSVCCLRPNQA